MAYVKTRADVQNVRTCKMWMLTDARGSYRIIGSTLVLLRLHDANAAVNTEVENE